MTRMIAQSKTYDEATMTLDLMDRWRGRACAETCVRDMFGYPGPEYEVSTSMSESRLWLSPT